jgi:hypothetical protein
MLIGNIQQILNQLTSRESVKVSFNDSEIIARLIEDASKLSLTTLVYDGGNYIPASVRYCLSSQSPFSYPSISTFLTIDEQKFQVKLNYLGQAQPLNPLDFKELLENFNVMAEKWRLYLDTHGKNDLIYVKAK